MRRGYYFFIGILFIFSFLIFEDVLASSFNFKIPFPNGEKWKITQGYEGDGWGSGKPTHHSQSKDKYAIDFSIPGEADLGKSVFSSAGGIVRVKQQIRNGRLTGYGKYVDIEHGNGLISRYAHLLSFSVEDGQEVIQGQEIGRVDNTGYQGGSHLHFAIYQKDANGKLNPYKPEPMSGYTDFKAGEWYTSDNELYDPNKKLKNQKNLQQKNLGGKRLKNFWV